MDNSIIRQLHKCIIREESYDEKISRKTKKEIKEFLQNVDTEEYAECYRDDLFLVAETAEENGFVMGFAYAFKLFSECAGK